MFIHLQALGQTQRSATGDRNVSCDWINSRFLMWLKQHNVFLSGLRLQAHCCRKMCRELCDVTVIGGVVEKVGFLVSFVFMSRDHVNRAFRRNIVMIFIFT